MTEKYNADLANGLGNLTSRVIKLAEKNEALPKAGLSDFLKPGFRNMVENLELSSALEYIWDIIKEDNKYIEDNKPWELAKNDEKKFRKVMEKILNDLSIISELLIPFLPETAEKIKKALETKKVEPLFQRIK